MAVERRLLPWLLPSAGPLAVSTIVLLGALAGAQVAAPPTDPLKELAPGLLARTIYTAEGSEPYRVEIWELVVGPGMKSETTALAGGVVLEVRGGRGYITIDDKRQELRLGATLAVDDGHKFALENADKESPLSLRGVVISAASR